MKNPGQPVYDVESRKFVDVHDLEQPAKLDELFTAIYRTNQWGSMETRSGPGSERDRVKSVVPEMEDLAREIGATSILDASCGDFNWMRDADLSGISYIGGDIVSELVESNNRSYGGSRRAFQVLDITANPLPRVDLVLCRDALVHFSDQHALAALRNFKRSGSAYLLTTTFNETAENVDIVTGWWRPLNLRRPPFNLPPQLREVRDDRSDDFYDDKVLALWRIEDIPVPSL